MSGSVMPRNLMGATFVKAMPLCIGFMLIVASVLKLANIETPGIRIESWMTLAIVQIEIGVAFWLIFGEERRAASWFAVALFAAFASMNLIAIINDQQDCGCLGIVKVAPWKMLAFDVMLMAILILIASQASGHAHTSTIRAFLTFLFVNLALLCMIQGIIERFFISTDAAIARLRGQTIIPIKRLINMGPLSAGTFHRVPVHIYNAESMTTQVIGGTSTCGCTAIDGLPAEINSLSNREFVIGLTVPNVPGQFESLAEYYTDNPNTPRFYVRIVGESVAP
jgi:hypothetical protein